MTLLPRTFVAQRIVIIEDNPDARDMLGKLLELAGHEVVLAIDGRSGVQRILHDHPSIAIVDLGLPGMDGYAVARQVRTLRPDASPPLLIALTGHVISPVEVLAAGFDYLLTKPVRLEELVQVFRHHFGAEGE